MRRFTLAQLEAFDAICRLGTFHAAAAALHVTQPTITLRIRELESAMGATLFVRRGRSVQLSAEGTLMAQYVAQGLLLLKEMEEQVQTGDPLRGSLRLGTSEMFAITCLPQVIELLEATYPDLQVELTVATSVALADLINSNKLDIAILADPQVKPHVEVEPIAQAEVAWVGSARRAARSAPLRPKDLQGEKVLTVPPPSTLNTMIRRWCSSDHTPAPQLSTCNSIVIIARLVASGMAMSVLPVSLLQHDIDSGLVVRYRHRGELPPLTICAAYRKGLRTTGISAVVRVTRDVMQRTGHFRMVQA